MKSSKRYIVHAHKHTYILAAVAGPIPLQYLHK